MIYSGFPIGTHQVSHNKINKKNINVGILFFKNAHGFFFTPYKGIAKTNEHSFMISKHIKAFGENNGPNGFVRFFIFFKSPKFCNRFQLNSHNVEIILLFKKNHVWAKSYFLGLPV